LWEAHSITVVDNHILLKEAIDTEALDFGGASFTKQIVDLTFFAGVAAVYNA
jgi:hypothetical protein